MISGGIRPVIFAVFQDMVFKQATTFEAPMIIHQKGALIIGELQETHIRFSTGNLWVGNSIPIPIPIWLQCGTKPLQCCRIPWVCPPPTSLKPHESSLHMSIDMVACFLRYWQEEEEEGLTYLYMQPCESSPHMSIDMAAHFMR